MNSNFYRKQKGTMLIITFLTMVVLLAIVVNLSAILFSEIKITANMGDSSSSLYAAITGAEEVLYFDKKQIPVGASRGFCNICNICQSIVGCDYDNCPDDLDPDPAINGCDLATCNNCGIKYNAVVGDRSYHITAKIIPDPRPIPNGLMINILSKGIYKDTARLMEFNIFDNP